MIFFNRLLEFQSVRNVPLKLLNLQGQMLARQVDFSTRRQYVATEEL